MCLPVSASGYPGPWSHWLYPTEPLATRKSWVPVRPHERHLRTNVFELEQFDSPRQAGQPSGIMAICLDLIAGLPGKDTAHG